MNLSHVMGAAVMVSAAGAAAAPLTFTNLNLAFEWQTIPLTTHGAGGGVIERGVFNIPALDITRNAGQPGDASVPHSLLYGITYIPVSFPGDPNGFQLVSQGMGMQTHAAFARGASVTLPSGWMLTDVPLTLRTGDVVGPQLDFTQGYGPLSHENQPTGETWRLSDGHAYVGLRLELATGTHYGWALIAPRYLGVLPDSIVFDRYVVLAWGYESSPGTPIVIPASDSITPCFIATDINSDGLVNGADLSVMLTNFGAGVTPGFDGDANHDGVVNAADLSVLLAQFNTSCSVPAPG